MLQCKHTQHFKHILMWDLKWPIFCFSHFKKNKNEVISFHCYKKKYLVLSLLLSFKNKKSFFLTEKMELNLFRHVFCLSWPQNFLLLISFMHDDTSTRWMKVIMKNHRIQEYANKIFARSDIITREIRDFFFLIIILHWQ